MFGWLRAEAARASFSKRESRSASADTSAGSTLIATSRPSRVSPRGRPRPSHPRRSRRRAGSVRGSGASPVPSLGPRCRRGELRARPGQPTGVELGRPRGVCRGGDAAIGERPADQRAGPGHPSITGQDDQAGAERPALKRRYGRHLSFASEWRRAPDKSRASTSTRRRARGSRTP